MRSQFTLSNLWEDIYYSINYKSFGSVLWIGICTVYSMYNMRKNAKTKNINHEVEKSGYNRGGELEFCNGVMQSKAFESREK